jgi:hypothetical protein
LLIKVCCGTPIGRSGESGFCRIAAQLLRENIAFRLREHELELEVILVVGISAPCRWSLIQPQRTADDLSAQQINRAYLLIDRPQSSLTVRQVMVGSSDGRWSCPAERRVSGALDYLPLTGTQQCVYAARIPHALGAVVLTRYFGHSLDRKPSGASFARLKQACASASQRTFASGKSDCPAIATHAACRRRYSSECIVALRHATTHQKCITSMRCAQRNMPLDIEALILQLFSPA